jgi:hypothetical protein
MPIHFYWAVPEPYFEGWRPSSGYKRAGKLLGAKALDDDPLVRRIVQWVLKVELGPA